MSSTQAGGDSRTEQAAATAQQAAEQVKETTQQATQQARGRVRDEVDRRSTDAGQQASSVADAFRQSAQQLRQDGKDGVAKPIEQVADRVQSAGSWLERSSGDDILGDVEDFARRKPLAVLAGGAVVGFALSRLLKASSTQRYAQSTGTTGGPHGAPARGNGNGDRLPATRPEPPIGGPAAPVTGPGAVIPEPPRGPGSY
jgi:ElaB/YqjD/DUF883 family membrane-anchored ribosome-binding protein